ncbi:hypothetical protein [Croceicoccus hydrothermalis]|uniref:hypothetical protein n=1 Tax=Croceicoccus hydrothermalis TaxID=2867964 RepID=UPI001EFAB9B2|nr:hypothetical protein [Croceicoccus hydrothermalis]
MVNEVLYPGALASVQEIQALADEYRKAASILRPSGTRGKPISHAPMRLVAIQAIELYLNALLLNGGHSPAEVRGTQHDLAKKKELAIQCGLVLRARTAAHLCDLVERREYLVSRYGPELASSVSQINRLLATLYEVGNKISKIIGQKDCAPAP